MITDWRWTEGCKDEKYWKIIQMFQDKKSSYYSIQQIGIHYYNIDRFSISDIIKQVDCIVFDSI